MSQRVMAMTGQTVTICLSLAHTVNTLRAANAAAKAEAFVCALWHDWRSEEMQSAKDMHTAVGCFFDFYFSSRGDFERVEASLTAAIPAQFREEVLTDMRKFAAERLRELENCDIEIGIQVIPTLPESEAN
jgi:hypothetical protein